MKRQRSYFHSSDALWRALKKINIGPCFLEGEQYSPRWTAALLPQNVDDRHDLRAAMRLPMESLARCFRPVADGLLPVATLVWHWGLEPGAQVLGASSARHLALHPKVHQDANGGVEARKPRQSGTQLHAVVDGKGRLVKAMLTAGQVSDAKIGPELVTGLLGVRIVGDKRYDSQAIRQAACRSGSHSCIPRRAGSKEPTPFHQGYYRKRHHVGNFFQRIK